MDSGHADVASAAAVNLGILHASEGDVAGARAAFQRANHSGHADAAPAAAVGLGILRAGQGDLPGARAAFQRALDSGHSDAVRAAGVNLGILLTGQGDLPGARAAFQRAIDAGDGYWAPKAVQLLDSILSKSQSRLALRIDPSTGGPIRTFDWSPNWLFRPEAAAERWGERLGLSLEESKTPSGVTRLGCSGTRYFVLRDDPNRGVLVYTNFSAWDAMADDRVRPNVQRQARQIKRCTSAGGLAPEIAAIVECSHPKRKRRAALIADTFAEYGIGVAWRFDTGTAAAPRLFWNKRGSTRGR